MNDGLSVEEARDLVLKEFGEAKVEVGNILVRDYPEETIFIVEVSSVQLHAAADVGNRIDRVLTEAGFDGFVTVRRMKEAGLPLTPTRLQFGVRDERAEEFVRLLTERSRTSEVQPSLTYVKDAAANISNVLASRHHLIFGRRGAGKTALMLEAKRLLEESGEVAAWLNCQTVRREPLGRVFLWTLDRIVGTLRETSRQAGLDPGTSEGLTNLARRTESALSSDSSRTNDVVSLIPYAQRALRRFLEIRGVRLFIFLDDFHYIHRTDQAQLLDLLHASIRDCDAWLKVASIRHLTRWFNPAEQMGLQTGQDANVVDLDVTLQDPLRAKSFLEEVLAQYATHVRIPALWQLFHPQALDRLVLASGAVPRDYLVLAAASIRKARTRPNARQVGGQDVNNAAGEAAQVKLGELEEDLATDEALSAATLSAFARVREFCLDKTRWTFFRIDFKDKEKRADEYALLQNVVDLRLVHLINPGVSHESRAGERFEVFMLDLSQYTGQRLKKNIQVLDFVGGHFVSKRTGTRASAIIGNTPKRLIQILRRPPVMSLDMFSDIADAQITV